MTQLERLTPTAAQETAIHEMATDSSGAAVVGSDLGTGKTVVAVETALRRDASVVLISAPLHTRYGWEYTVLRQTDYKASFRVVNRSTKAGKQALADLQWGVPGWYFIGRELARLMDWTGVHPDVWIADECHSMCNRTSKGFKTAMKLRKQTKYTILQSATWHGSSFEGAWAIGRIAWPEIVPRSYWLWIATYAETVYDHFAPQQKKVVGEKKPGEFTSTFPTYINLRNTATQPPMVEEVYIDLYPSQAKMYAQMETNMVAWLGENDPLAADYPITQRIRLRQMTLGEATILDNGTVDFRPDGKSAKYDALREFLSDIPNEKVLIATDSAKYARLVASRLSDAFAWTGDKSQDEREAAKREFIEGDLKYIVATQPSISEGTDGLQAVCHIMVELSQNDSPLLNQQMVGRLNRTGQSKRVLVYRILARNTLDDSQALTLLQKERMMAGVMMKEEEV